MRDEYVLIVFILGFILGVCLIGFSYEYNLGNILEVKGLMYQKDCNAIIDNYTRNYGCAYINSSDYGFNDFAINPKLKDYTWIHIYPPKNSSIVISECVNSTLKLNKTSIWCER